MENFDEIALSHTVKEIEGNLCFCIFGQNSKIQHGRHFGERNIFLKIANSTFIRYPVGQKFRRNCSICMVKEIEANLCFSIFGKNSKWPPFLGRGNFFGKLPKVHSLDTLWVENFDEIALSRTV